MSPALYFLALPSLVAFLLLVTWVQLNLGARRTLIYFGSLLAYGWIRATWLEQISKDDLQSAFPYLLNVPVFKLAGVSLQELIGWSVAVTLAWILATKLWRGFGLQPGAHCTAIGAALVLAAVCLTVETAAIESGWWQWTLILKDRPFFGRVPLIGLVDWAFVAFDFLLPMLLFLVPARWSQRIPALCLFVLHFRFHGLNQVFPGPIPLSPNDLMHTAIVAYVLLLALGEKGTTVLPEPRHERLGWLPLAAAGLVVAATALSSILVAGHPERAVASLPLLAMAVGAQVLPLRRTPREQPRGSRRLWLARIVVVVGAFLVIYAVRAPFHRRTDQFLSHLRAANGHMNKQQWSQAETEIRQAIAIRPEHPGGHSMLAQVLLLGNRWPEARVALDQTLATSATDLNALILMAVLEVKEQRWEQAAAVAATGHRVYPDRLDFEYFAAIAATHGPAAVLAPEVQAVVDRARRGGEKAIQAVGNAAFNLNDTATLGALMRRAAL